MPTPLLFSWEGDCFKPIPRHAKECDVRYVIGEHYALDEIQQRSSRAHAHYFACVGQAWVNLPDHIADKFATSEHLRKHALVRTGFFDKRSIQTANKTEALRLAAFIRPMDDFAIVTVSNSLVEVFTAKSQSHRAMPRAEFQASKTAVLEWIATLIDVTPAKLDKAGAEA